MAAPRKIIVLDLGMQSLRVAEFASTAGNGIKLLRGARREFLLDPALDTSRPDQVRLSTQEILKEWGVGSAEAVCVLPSHSVFTRVVSLDVPGGASGNVDAVAKFEAQQNIPFPLEEVVWDYTITGENGAGGVNVVFVAVKTDLLDSLCKEIERTGLRIISVTVSPLALYDAYMACYPEAHSSTTALIDIGCRTTNMVIASAGSFFSRSIPSGGFAVTTAISKDIHADLEEAEHLKVTRGSVALGPGFEPPTDPVEANLARIARQTLIKTQTDIARSIGYYRSTHGGSDPEQVLVTGGMASLPYLAEFLHEKLQKPVQFFDPLRELSSEETSHSAASEFIQANSNNLGELVGGALELIPGKRTSINLLPPSISAKREFAKRLPYLAAAAAVFVLSLGAWWISGRNAAIVTRQEAQKIQIQIDGYSTVDKQMQALLAKQGEIEKTSGEILSSVALREAYPRIIAELAAKVPDRYLWITEVEPAPDVPQKTAQGKGAASQQTQPATPGIKAVLVKGLYLDNPKQASVIDDFVTALQSSDVFLVEEKEKSKITTERGSPNSEFWAFPFSLRIPLRTPISTIP